MFEDIQPTIGDNSRAGVIKAYQDALMAAVQDLSKRATSRDASVIQAMQFAWMELKLASTMTKSGVAIRITDLRGMTCDTEFEQRMRDAGLEILQRVGKELAAQKRA